MQDSKADAPSGSYSAQRRRAATSDSIGIAVVGAGRIGSHRARLAAEHPRVGHLVVADTDPARAQEIGELVGSDRHTDDWAGAITDPDVHAVVVSTPEHVHTDAVMLALQSGKPVLVEKPIAMTLEDAALVTRTSDALGVELRVGYSQRFKREHFLARHEILNGSLGKVFGVMARIYNTRATAEAILRRVPDATPVVDVLTYYVDLVSWFLGEDAIEVSAKGAGDSFKRQGYAEIDDVTWCFLRYPGGALATLGISFALSAQHPTQGQLARIEMLGEEGSMFLDGDHSGNLLFTDRGYSHAYNPNHSQPAVYLGTRSPGDWALGRMFGPLADETRDWLDHVGGDTSAMHHTTSHAAFAALSTTLAMERSLRLGTAERPATLADIPS